MHFIIEASFVSGFRIESISMEVKSPERRGRMGEVQQIGCSLFMLWAESLGRGKDVKEVKAVNPGDFSHYPRRIRLAFGSSFRYSEECKIRCCKPKVSLCLCVWLRSDFALCIMPAYVITWCQSLFLSPGVRSRTCWAVMLSVSKLCRWTHTTVATFLKPSVQQY